MIQRLFSFGVRELFAGFRYGQPLTAAFGAAITIIMFLRKRRPPARRLLTAFNLDPGEGASVRYMRDDVVIRETRLEG